MLADADAVPQPVVTAYVIVEAPAATPVTTPVVEFTDAAAALLLLQVPPLIPLVVNVVDKPLHTDDAPLIEPAFATAFTLTSCVAVDVPQPFDTVYVIVVFPGVTLVTTPVVASTVAIPIALLLHDPPLFPVELKLIVEPIHTDDPPLIVPAFRTGFTVTGADAVAVPHKVVTV